MKKLLALLVSIMLIFSLFTFGITSTASAAVSGDFRYEMDGGGGAVVTGFANGVDFQGELVIPTELNGFTITGIEKDAFKDCTGITSVTIGEFIGSIGTNAFAGCTNLKTVNYDATRYSNKHSAGSVDNPVFAGCTSLTTVNIGANVESIPKYLFYGVETLAEVNFAGERPKIGQDAFTGCPLVESLFAPVQSSSSKKPGSVNSKVSSAAQSSSSSTVESKPLPSSSAVVSSEEKAPSSSNKAEVSSNVSSKPTDTSSKKEETVSSVVSKPIATSSETPAESEVDVSSEEDEASSSEIASDEDVATDEDDDTSSKTTGADTDDNEGGNNTLIFLWIGVAVALIALAGVTVFLLKK